MASGKALGHDGIFIELIKLLWLILGNGFYRIIRDNIEQGVFLVRIIKEVLSLIPKEKDSKNLNN